MALLRFCFPLSCRAICPTLGVVVIGTKGIANEGVCVRLSFPCFAVFTLCVRVFCLFSHYLKWCFAGCDHFSRLYSLALLQFSSWLEWMFLLRDRYVPFFMDHTLASTCWVRSERVDAWESWHPRRCPEVWVGRGSIERNCPLWSSCYPMVCNYDVFFSSYGRVECFLCFR